MTLRVIAGILAVLALALLSYAGWQWFSARPVDDGAVKSPDSRVIPLAIPQKKPTSAGAESEGPAIPPGQATRPAQN